MLSRLSGRCHRVLTGVAVADSGRCHCAVDESLVWFRELDAADIDCYGHRLMADACCIPSNRPLPARSPMTRE
jgi:predicted house-cleaning NTP pyrophosphatase (Maf/HAM1 superfamily)